MAGSVASVDAEPEPPVRSFGRAGRGSNGARAGGRGADNSIVPFLGSAVAKYDVDELDDLGRQPKREKFVEVRRPDGTVAKSRGERTFYGAFTGGFSAGYWGTVGSKEGWEPATFSSSRSRRESRGTQRVEDLMDEEDLHDYRASHMTLEAHGEFDKRHSGGVAAAAADRSAVPGGLLPRQVERELFGGGEALGERLLRAADTGERSEPPPPKKRYGCAPPPLAASGDGSAGAGSDAAEKEASTGLSWEFKLLPALSAARWTAEDRRVEVEVERLWRCKADLHGVGFGQGGAPAVASASRVPSSQRLYMSSRRAAGAGRGSGYGDFGTGVFDMDDNDHWEDIYDSTGDQLAAYELALKDADVDDASEAIVRRDSRPAGPVEGLGPVPGFVAATGSAEPPTPELSRHLAPRPPQGYRGVLLGLGSAADEARDGSAEHRQLLDFLGRHGDRRLVDPTHRAELLGMRARRVIAAPTAVEVGPSAVPASASQSSPTTAGASGVDMTAAAQAASGPLWRGVDDARKAQLLQALGRNFVVGEQQDMDGRTGRHQPFRSDPPKQQRYAAFCLALEGKASASEALAQSGGLSEAERQAELAEFGRVFRMFKQECPNVDIAVALGEATGSAGGAAMAPVLRRIVQPWAPSKLLCKRWGVPEPESGAPQELPCARRQREYAEQVRVGLARAAAAPGSSEASPAPALAHAGFTDGPPATGPAPATETAAVVGGPPRPPRSLFASIFGDEDSGDDA